MPVGLTVMLAVPEPVTAGELAAMISNTESSLECRMVMFPVSELTGSLKFNARFALSPTPVASSMGVVLTSSGGIAWLVKFQLVLSAMPA